MKVLNDERLLLTERQAARLYGMSTSWFQLQRRKCSGPKYLKIGRSVRYVQSDLDFFFGSKKICPNGQSEYTENRIKVQSAAGSTEKA